MQGHLSSQIKKGPKEISKSREGVGGRLWVRGRAGSGCVLGLGLGRYYDFKYAERGGRGEPVAEEVDPVERSRARRSLRHQEVPTHPRRSIIAKLPGDKKVFMGNKLEILCLLQAAEIERLALNLDDYRAKYPFRHSDCGRSRRATSTATPTRSRSRSWLPARRARSSCAPRTRSSSSSSTASTYRPSHAAGTRGPAPAHLHWQQRAQQQVPAGTGPTAAQQRAALTTQQRGGRPAQADRDAKRAANG